MHSIAKLNLCVFFLQECTKLYWNQPGRSKCAGEYVVGRANKIATAFDLANEEAPLVTNALWKQLPAAFDVVFVAVVAAAMWAQVLVVVVVVHPLWIALAVYRIGLFLSTQTDD